MSIMVLTLALLALSASMAEAALRIVVLISRQELWIEQSGTRTYLGPVSTARRGYRTPRGTFKPVRLVRTWYSTRYDWSPMPYSIFFHRGYAIHGTLESRKLGRAVSHGCIRLSIPNAKTLYHLVRAAGRGKTTIVIRE